MLASLAEKLVQISRELVDEARKYEKKRYLYYELKRIDPEYYIGIKGLRGVGKTVLMLQLAAETEKSVYFSADSVLISKFSLYEIVKELTNLGYTNIFIDEIHSRPEWDKEIKSLYDEHVARIIFSGSSAIDIVRTGADLSRRVVMEELRIVSFREFLNIWKGYNIPAISLDKILSGKELLTKEYMPAYKFFDEYLRYGGVLYPRDGFFGALENSLKKVATHDLGAFRDINVKYETDVYKLLHIVAHSPPFEVNYSSLARDLEISKNMAIRMVDDLAMAGLLIPILPCRQGVDVRKEPKIYLTIPIREFFARGNERVKGALREEFLVNHLRNLCYIKSEKGKKTPDFKYRDIMLEREITIEVGGIGKKTYQEADYIAVDGISTVGNRVPLFLFGFLY
ncbi:MAG: AAA family ATPase [Candidatus Korarchaeota archaeon]